MTHPSSPQITILTPSYNQAAFIEQTILSVIDQDYPRVQHIVIDGGSTDGTLEILRKYSHLTWISEKDRGQADALRKGLELSTGDIVGWLNSDDFYEPKIFERVVVRFQNPSTSWVIGNLTYLYGETGTTVLNKSPHVTHEALLHNPDIVRQQPTFFRRAFLEQAGGWNPEYFMAMDFDLWVRLAKLVPPLMVDEGWAYFRHHAAQKTSLTNTRRQSNEIRSILKREGASPVVLAKFYLHRRWLLTKGHLKNWLIAQGVIPARYRNRPIRLAVKA